MKITLTCNNIRYNKIMITSQQQLPTIIMDKSNPTMREELIIISITSLTITLTPRHIVTSNKKKKNNNWQFGKTRINKLTIASIRICATTLNIVITNIIVAKLLQDLKWFIW